MAALALFIISFFTYYRYWNSPTVGTTAGIVLTALGVALTVAASFQGWILIQKHHVGVHLTPDQQRLEREARSR
jgi:multisubunit Na+/H+ antiporter MnhG subunit